MNKLSHGKKDYSGGLACWRKDMHEKLAQARIGPDLVGKPSTVTEAGLELVRELEGRLDMSCMQASSGKLRA